MGGQVDVVFANGRIEVSWSPATETATPSAKAMAAITPLLKQRRYGEARPLLEALLKAEPENRDALYNLGMVASDEGQLKEARELLRRSVAVDPSFPMRRWPWGWQPCGTRTRRKHARRWSEQLSWSRATPMRCAPSAACSPRPEPWRQGRTVPAGLGGGTERCCGQPVPGPSAAGAGSR